MLEVTFHPRANKELLKIPKKQRLKILDDVDEMKILDHPLKHRNVLKLRGPGKRQDFRMRVGDYRVKFTFLPPRTILVTNVHHRQAGY